MKSFLIFLIAAFSFIPHFVDAGPGGPSFPAATTLGSSQSGETITLIGNILSTGSVNVLERGFVYGTTTSYNATTSETGTFSSTGPYSLSLSGLTTGGTYYYKAFVRNSVGTAYASSGRTFYVQSSSSPRIELVSTTTTGAFPIGNAVGVNSTAYTISYDNAIIYKYDVSNKTAPTLLGSATTTSQPGYIITEGNYAYVSTYTGNILTYSITASTSPILLNTYTYGTGYGLGNMHILDGYLYVTASKSGAGKIVILDITNPAQPSFLSEISVGTTGGGDVQKRGNYIYYADYVGKTLQIWDVSDILNPSQKQLITGVTEPLDYHTFEPWKILIKGDTLYLFDDEIIQTYDISSSTNMVYRTTTVAYRDVEGAVISGNLLYYSSTFDHLFALYDISSPYSPVMVGFVDTGTANRFLSIDMDGYLYSSAGNTLEIYRPIKVPSLDASSSSGLSSTTVTLSSAITSDNSASSTDRGFYYGITDSYGFVASTTGVFGVGSFSQNITDLICATTYHYQAFAKNVVGFATTSDSTFVTSSCPTEESQPATSFSGGRQRLSVSALSKILAPGPSTSQYLSSIEDKDIAKSVPRTVMFSKNLSLGVSSTEVMELQKYLNSKGYVVSKSGAGSPGAETNKFGLLTKSALAKFQKANGIPSTGYFGPITRAFISSNP